MIQVAIKMFNSFMARKAWRSSYKYE